ncbi:hypothetical protein PF011_g19705 [Phytophthora fragariae]|uniref:Ion transport domain-containing protein n=1 Tax=Phytophthora fragariae TaxID=53985 RepID=A0A6A3IYK1_9STRA|nr:hypothetical protein PF011_g19705 [Phytophthora fragariae]
MGSDTQSADVFMYNLRILRAIRLIVVAYAYVGTKVLFQAAINSIPPLTITLFFLVTVVMVFATAIFYAEPCYDLKTCTFTDILNTGYFVMLTVATVGYGSQVPSLHNAGSLLLVCIVMIFGQVYFSMPLAIIGVKYELAWTEYDEYAGNLKSKQSRPQREKKRSSKLSADMSGRQIVNALAGIDENDELEKIEAHTMKFASSNACDRFYQLSQAILEVNSVLQFIVSPPANTTDVPVTLESVIQSTKRRSDEASQALDGVISVIKLHSRVCAEAHELLVALKSPVQEQETDLDRFLSSGTLASKSTHSFGSHNMSRIGRAKGAIVALGTKAVKAISHHDYHVDPKSLRAEIWNIFEYRHDTPLARAVNKVRMYTIVLSIAVYYLQTTSELQKTGVQTFLCQRNIDAFCDRYDDAGCYVFEEVSGAGSGLSVQVTDKLVDFSCAIGDPDETCYASGVNFGSENFPLSCSDVFPSHPGITYVCNSRLCNPPVQFMFDMEPYWIYFEFLFGFLFTLELVLRVYAHPVRRHIWGDMKVLISVIVLIPFYVELVEIMIGEWPTYSVVPTLPSFYSVIRFLKSLRILKLGSHIPGSRVLIKTAHLTMERLAVPFFFLFLGCVVSAAVFFELERGTECFVGKTCTWWHKSVLTSELSEGLPPGKRILVQNTLLTIITDMLRSTWLSLVTFTTVGYGDLYPRTSLGKLVDIFGMVFSSCYTAMPLTLVGGQFYICYELHAQEKRLKRQRAQTQIKPESERMRSLKHAFPSTREILQEGPPSESRQAQDKTRTNSQAMIDAVENFKSLPSLSARSMSDSSLPITDRGEHSVSRQQYTHSTEIQIIHHFFLMQKVFNETIKDISLLNRLGVERVNVMRKNSSEAATILAEKREREIVIEEKISENMEFCVTACLNFAAIMDRILGTQRTRNKDQRPSISQANALFSVAELMQKKSFKVGRKTTTAGTEMVPNSNESPTLTPTTEVRQKRTSFRRIATLSKIFVGPILHKRDPKPPSGPSSQTRKTNTKTP